MNKTSRLVLFVLAMVSLLFLGIIFAPWVVPNVVMPVALTVWLFLRIFILSVDQAYYWWLLTAAVTLWAAFRLLYSEEQPGHTGQDKPADALTDWQTWQTRLGFSKSEIFERDRVRQELITMLAALYASKQHGVSQMEMRSALEKGDLPVPGKFYRFLFPPEPELPARQSLKTVLRAFYRTLQGWYRRQTGQDRAEFNRTIDELIEFMENSLES